MDSSPPDWACPEKQLLIYCARLKARPDVAQRIRELASGPLDWDFLISDAADNGLVPLLHLQISANAADKVPASEMDRLKAAAFRNTARCLLLTGELIKVMTALESNAISAIPHKGPVLAVQAYGDIALRQYEDLDIILRQKDLLAAHEVMIGLGYSAKYPWIHSAGGASSLHPGDYAYVSDDRQLMVELHSEQSLRHFPVPPALHDFRTDLKPVSLSGHTVETFRPEDALVILCIHGSKHFWERISWITDISEMIRSHPDLDWGWIYRRADSLRAGRMVNVALALTVNLLGARLPLETSARVTADREAVKLAEEISGRLLNRQLLRMSATARFNFRRRAVPGAMAGWSYAARLTTAPAEEDWEMLRLPRVLSPLYIALRPLRLLRKYRAKD